MKRREFLKQGSTSLTGFALAGPSVCNLGLKPAHRRGKSGKVLIIGAGLTGLVAGYQLKKAGFEVLILEARSTPGGRVRTLRAPFADGLHAELGASRIMQDHRLVRQYAEVFGLSLVPFYPADQEDLLDAHGKNVRIGDAVSQDYAHYPARYRHNIYERKHHPIVKIAGGMDQLPAAFAAELQHEIHYGAPVVRLGQDKSRAWACYEQNGRISRAEAEYLICTLPFSVLRHIAVQPAFSEAKTRAIFAMPYHATCRILFQSRRRFWEKQKHNGFAIDEQGEVWHPTFDQPGPRGILAYYPGQYVVRNLSNGKRVSYAVHAIKKFYPQVKSYLEGHHAIFWDEDRYARGAVSNPETLGQVRSTLHQPEGRIYLAGEHISSRPRWMEGALESGVQVVRQIVEAD